VESLEGENKHNLSLFHLQRISTLVQVYLHLDLPDWGGFEAIPLQPDSNLSLSTLSALATCRVVARRAQPEAGERLQKALLFPHSIAWTIPIG